MAQVKVTITTDEGEVLDIFNVEVSAYRLSQMGMPNSEVAASLAVQRVLNDSPFLAVLDE